MVMQWVSYERVTAIAEVSIKSSKASADMDVNIPKTKTLHVRQQEEVSKTTDEEVRSRCKFQCLHPGCDHVFLTKRGLSAHAGKYQWRNEFVVGKTLDHKDTVNARQYLVR